MPLADQRTPGEGTVRLSEPVYTISPKKNSRLFNIVIFYNLKKLEPIFIMFGALYPNSSSF